MKTKILLLFASIFMISLSSCDDILERPQLTSPTDENFWTSEDKLRLYANEFYERFFTGYNVKNSIQYAPHLGYLFNDDVVTYGNQTYFESSVPTDRSSTTTGLAWLERYSGPTWNFAWIRKANIMLDRIESRMGGILSQSEKEHWMAIGRFFRAMDYAQLVQVFGDVPYYDKEVSDVDPDELYKARTPRNEVMDRVYDDLKYAMTYTRLNDGEMYVNRYIVAAYVSRLALFEGTWQKYHNNDNARARKFLELALEAANMVKNSGKYDIVTDFRSLFGSKDLAGNKDVILYRRYDGGYDVLHSIATSCNMVDGRYTSPNLSLIKSFICVDGSDWQTSADDNNKNFSIDNLIKTRDSRFEASFWHKTTLKGKGSYLYLTKFISRDGLKYLEEGRTNPDQEYTSTYNDNAYPVMRYAEVLLNLIEAKAELATIGGDAVVQSDIDETINKIRKRPIAEEAKARGVKETARLELANMPSSPDRDDIPQLIWEIRRERRMELAFEHSRLLDLKRWKKLSNMDTDQNPDLLRGSWINAADHPELLTADNIGVFAVTNLAGAVTIYTGSNASQMVGFYSPLYIKGRTPFLNIPNVNPYLAPVGKQQRLLYRDRGYELKQTEGWSSDL